jgi:pimeloyl-ACP methyl ester carboxylesterase
MPPATPAPIVSVKPLTLPDGDRGVDLSLRISAPLIGEQLPVVLFAHGFGSSADLYGPLTDYWAGSGFVVIQPTFLDSRTIDLPHDDPRGPGIWRQRVADLVSTLDHLDQILAMVPGLSGRVASTRIAVAGHSFGGQTAGILLGLRVAGADGSPGDDLADRRVKAGVLLGTAGRGGDALTPFAAENLPFLQATFDHMATPALIVTGDNDRSPLTVLGPEWTADPYLLSPGPKSLLTLYGGEHFLGGIAGYEAVENTDPDPARLHLLQEATTAYLRDHLQGDDREWRALSAKLTKRDAALGRLESR